MQTDYIFYALFKTAPALVLRLIGQQPTQGYQFSSVEVKETAFRFDGVLVPEVESAEQPTIFVEVQCQNVPSFYRRFFAEIFLFLRHNPDVTYWRAVVIFERRSREPKAPQRLPFLALLESPQIYRIYLEDLQKSPADSVETAILQLIVKKPQTAVQNARVLIDRAKNENDSDFSESQIIGLIETIILCKFPKLDREVIAAMLGIDAIKQTRVYKDALEEGRQEGEYSIVLRQLAHRLGSLPEATVKKVQSLSSQQLEALSYRLLDLSTLEQLRDYLDSL